MATKKISDYAAVGSPASSGLLLLDQAAAYYSLSLNQISEYVQRNSNYSDLIETRTSDYDYSAAGLERDARIFANCTAATITLGLFNGSSRNGEITIITCIGTANQVNIELAAAGVTDIVLSPKDTLTVIWNTTTAAWQILSIDRNTQFEFIVKTQADFNFIVERVAANQYKFKDGFTSIYLKNLSGGYLMYGGTSPLSGGDTWGHIETNNCVNLIFESGAYIHSGNTQMYLEINTDDCYVLNANIIGLGTVASAISQSFLMGSTNNRITLNNCKTSTRLTNTAFIGFGGGGTNRSNKVINCTVYDITGTSVGTYGFYSIEDVVGCQVMNLTQTTSAAGNVAGFQLCTNLNDCYAYDIDSATFEADGFNQCSYLNNCTADKIDHSGAVAAKNAYGFYQCNYMSNCYANDVDTNGAGGEATGFKSCNEIGTSLANDCNSHGFSLCSILAACKATTNGAQGFSECNNLSSCISLSNTGRGFNVCNELAACRAESNGTFGYSDCYRISVSQALNNGTWGFNASRQLHSNYATGNPSGKYTGCFADFAGANAVADTAAGGYNA